MTIEPMPLPAGLWSLAALADELVDAMQASPAGLPGGGLAPAQRMLAAVPDGTSRHLNAGITALPPGYRGGTHVHDAEELIICVRGSGDLVIDGQPWHLAEGSVLFAPANAPHYSRVDDGGPMVVIWAYGPAAAEIVKLPQEG